jgi:hypothetical protein
VDAEDRGVVGDGHHEEDDAEGDAVDDPYEVVGMFFDNI